MKHDLKKHSVITKGNRTYKKLSEILSNYSFYFTIAILSLIWYYMLNSGFYAISADEAGHTPDGYQFYHGNYNLFMIWLPFLKVFYGLLFHLCNNLFWIPRIASMIFAFSTAILLIKLTMKLFNSESRIIAAFIVPLFVGISLFGVLPLTEIYFFFFLILSLYLFDSKWSFIPVILMTTIRYEGWIFAFLIAVFKYKQLKWKSVFMLSFPALWVLLSYINTGSIWGFMNEVSQRRILVVRKEDTQFYNFLWIGLTSGNFLLD